MTTCEAPTCSQKASIKKFTAEFCFLFIQAGIKQMSNEVNIENGITCIYFFLSFFVYKTLLLYSTDVSSRCWLKRHKQHTGFIINSPHLWVYCIICTKQPSSKNEVETTNFGAIHCWYMLQMCKQYASKE